MRRIIACLTLVVALLVGSGSALAAETPAPWWGVTSGARPTNLQGGSGKDEVLRLKVNATGGDYLIVDLSAFRAVSVPFDASASVLQEKLEMLYSFSREVAVSEEVSGEPDTRLYKIVFPDQRVGTLLTPPYSQELAELFGLSGGSPLVGGNAEATATEIQQGAPSENEVFMDAQDRGDANTSGTVTMRDSLPARLRPIAIEGYAGDAVGTPNNRGPVTCVLKTLTCRYGGSPGESLPAYEMIEVRISVEVLPGAKDGDANTASVSGGGAAVPATAPHALRIGTPEKFGLEDYQLIPENVNGTVDTQAGSHPFQVTSIATFNSATPEDRDREFGKIQHEPRVVAMARDIVAELPPGFIGNPAPFAQCTDGQFDEQGKKEGNSNIIYNECPPQSAIGVATITINEPQLLHFATDAVPIFNLVPLPGEPARFGFKVLGIVPQFLETSVRTGGDYGVTITASNISEHAHVLSSKLTFWGVPGDPRHDPQRGWECYGKFNVCNPSLATSPPPFLVMPTSCEEPFQSTAHADSWPAPGLASQDAEAVKYSLPEAIDGCNHLPFAPSLTVSPDVPEGSTPTGLTVGVHVPQAAALNPEGLAESALRNTTVALPEGVTLNPGGADGLESCTEAQVGFTGVESGGLERDLFKPGLEEPFCSDASKVATVKIRTPLLPNALEGEVYLASQNQNPFGSLVALYLVAQDPVSGTLIKLAGEVKPDRVTGQIVTTFKNTPELPFEDLELHFFGGSRAPLSTPPLCGAHTTSASFEPWSGNEMATASSTFNITSGPNGSLCHDPLPFSPSLTAGTTSIQAGGFSPFTMTMSRPDGSQNLQAIELKMPPGLLGTLASVKLCHEAQANAGTCGPESLIGHTTVSVGVGGNPYSVTGGEVFITEGYGGAPYGLSIVNPAKAGPFDLGNVIVRAKIEVDPITAVLTIRTDSTGPYKIPTILDGIPLQIQHVNVSIDRPNFTFNPTNCSQLPITGSLRSSQGATEALSVPFQVTNCAVLAFKPKLTAKTSGKTSRASGASLAVKLTYPAGPYDANIARVKVDLPKQLPSRLTTLQQACPAATFNANPATCPPASIVGHATATTPVMPVPLTGPAYFVSHGGEEFPELVIVLQGYGATIHLVGSTFINKAGITSSTFKKIPDVPVGTFELTLPQGKYSALASNGNLCTIKKLSMPTSFVAQNGVEQHTTTPIIPTGCTKHLQAKKTKHGKGKHKKKK